MEKEVPARRNKNKKKSDCVVQKESLDIKIKMKKTPVEEEKTLQSALTNTLSTDSLHLILLTLPTDPEWKEKNIAKAHQKYS